MKLYIILILIICTSFCYGQNTPLYLLSKNSEGIKISVTKDTSRASFTIYRRGFETKKDREMLANEQSKHASSDKDISKPPVSPPPLPQISFNYISVGLPEKLTTLSGINYITEEEYRNNEAKYIYNRNTYIFHRVKDGYLKWQVLMVPIE